MEVGPHDPAWPEHMAQVRHVAQQLRRRLPPHIELDDLVQAGMVGLLDAAQRYDGSRQVRFKSYAQFRIRGAMLDSLREMDWGPRELRRKGRAVQEAQQALRIRFGREPLQQEVADELRLDLRDYQLLLGELAMATSSPVGAEDTDYVEELMTMSSSSEDTPYAHVEQRELQDKVVAALEVLSEKERQVLALYYGEELNMKAIARLLGVGESRISQIHTSAVSHLRVALSGLRIARA